MKDETHYKTNRKLSNNFRIIGMLKNFSLEAAFMVKNLSFLYHYKFQDLVVLNH